MPLPPGSSEELGGSKRSKAEAKGTPQLFTKTGKGILTCPIFEIAFKRSVEKLMTRCVIELPLKKDMINTLLKQLTVHFHWQLTKIYEKHEQVRIMVKEVASLKDTATKMIKGTYRGPLPEYFRDIFDEIEDEAWKTFFIQRVIVFHDHFSSHGTGELGLDGKRRLSDDPRVKFSKAMFHSIPIDERVRGTKSAERKKKRKARSKASQD